MAILATENSLGVEASIQKEHPSKIMLVLVWTMGIRYNWEVNNRNISVSIDVVMSWQIFLK